MPTLNQIRETARQSENDDAEFLKRHTYYFELRLPPEVTHGYVSTFFFPLIIPPEAYEMDEPFALEQTRTLGGGLAVEENGIIERTIRIRGTTGFKPRAFPKLAGPHALQWRSEFTNFQRALKSGVVGAISGARHFQYLQDAVFRTYSDFKKDPATSKDTKLFLHVPAEGESWRVAPVSFKLKRDAKRKTLYAYDIELTATEPASQSDIDFSEDKSLLDQLKDVQAAVKDGLNTVSSAVQELTGLVEDVKKFINNFGVILSSITEVISAVQGFVDGVQSAISLPRKQVETLINDIRNGLEQLEQTELTLSGTVTPPPIDTRNAIMGAESGLMQILAQPSAFEEPTRVSMRDIRNSQNVKTANTQSDLDDAAEKSAPSSFSKVDQTTALKRGDKTRSEVSWPGEEVFDYPSAFPYTIKRGDTLHTLAMRFLGDATRWQYLAVINGLDHPYIDAMADKPPNDPEKVALPFVKYIGDEILIPSAAVPQSALPVVPVLGVRREQSAEEHFLGTDLKLTKVNGARELFDVLIDTTHGSESAELVTGYENLIQALMVQVTVEKGSDAMYRLVGLSRVVGTSVASIDLDLSRFRLIETMLRDSRITAVKNLTIQVTEDNPDTLEIDADLAVRGFAQSSNVKLEVS